MRLKLSTHWQNSRKKPKKLTAYDIVSVGLMVAALECAKTALAFLPNVELVSLLIILFTLVLGRRVYYAIVAFVLVEGVIYGFGLWWVMYLYAWPLLAWLTRRLRKQKDALTFAVLSGGFGLAFGALCSIPYFIAGGPAAGFTWWVAGIPFDIVHGISNFVLMLCLYKPVRSVLERFGPR